VRDNLTIKALNLIRGKSAALKVLDRDEESQNSAMFGWVGKLFFISPVRKE
jgi:hypothetical protein